MKARDDYVTGRLATWRWRSPLEGHQDVLGLSTGDGGEGGKEWFQALTEMRNRGASGVLMLVCDDPDRPPGCREHRLARDDRTDPRRLPAKKQLPLLGPAGLGPHPPTRPPSSASTWPSPAWARTPDASARRTGPKLKETDRVPPFAAGPLCPRLA
ncbi:transposase [Streptomyces sp. NPDC017260]|uniref:transposase n=1 Tax=unclassified Streptomyces TaxID=2593676 RepID=UPI003790E1EC